jgi:Ca2+-transporting ATPase
MTFESGMIGVGTMGAFIYGMRKYGLGPAPSTMAFNTLVLNELAHALSSRSHYRNVFGGEKLEPNKHLTRAVLGMAALQVVVSLSCPARGGCSAPCRWAGWTWPRSAPACCCR